MEIKTHSVVIRTKRIVFLQDFLYNTVSIGQICNQWLDRQEPTLEQLAFNGYNQRGGLDCRIVRKFLPLLESSGYNFF